ncbi:4016_t:CDS:2 [Diversispora eburnea]|uniref:4016_t:CDS:1 n=1 Tax=Diversispora eburnea TaxID=1213867 RepID=A0A9N9C4I0_9GLOM|nr:4016_t:CDS:2 [Diversispora eburnea]
MFLEQGSSSTSAYGEAQVLPFFDYPSFIKELKYTNLFLLIDKVEVESIIQMLTDRKVRPETFIIKNVHTNSAAYGLWTAPYYAPIFSTHIHVEVHFSYMNSGSGDILIKEFQSRLKSFQRLELVKWNFSECDWSWLNNCTNLIEFAITNPPPQVSRILGTENESYNFKPSKNKRSRALTEHWHFDKDDDKTLQCKNFTFILEKRRCCIGELKGYLT